MKEENKAIEEEREQENLIIVKDTMIPIKNPGVTVREEMEEDGKFMLFNAENELILMINDTGRFIFDHCNGEKNVAQLVKAIEDNYIVSGDLSLPEIVKNYIEILLKAKIIKMKGE